MVNPALGLGWIAAGVVDTNAKIIALNAELKRRKAAGLLYVIAEDFPVMRAIWAIYAQLALGADAVIAFIG